MVITLFILWKLFEVHIGGGGGGCTGSNDRVCALSPWLRSPIFDILSVFISAMGKRQMPTCLRAPLIFSRAEMREGRGTQRGTSRFTSQYSYSTEWHNFILTLPWQPLLGSRVNMWKKKLSVRHTVLKWISDTWYTAKQGMAIGTSPESASSCQPLFSLSLHLQ